MGGAHKERVRIPAAAPGNNRGHHLSRILLTDQTLKGAQDPWPPALAHVRLLRLPARSILFQVRVTKWRHISPRHGSTMIIIGCTLTMKGRGVEDVVLNSRIRRIVTWGYVTIAESCFTADRNATVSR